MRRLALSIFVVSLVATEVDADWQVYKENAKVVASVDYISYNPFHGQPSVWVRWHYKKPEKRIGGIKIQFTANCATHRLFEIESIPYDVSGRYLAATKSYNSPKEYALRGAPLNEATYELLCSRQWK